MLKQAGDRWSARTLWALIVLGALDRVYLLFVFGFRYIGIDDALIQQVAIDYGNGIFREPFLYGQNYNPMLEALLAAPFVHFGGASWIVLPIVTSFLALIPFWSLALWFSRKGHHASAVAVALMPILLPTEWGMITSMSRGWVHGLAWLSAVPWLQGIRSSWVKHGTTALVLVMALFCNLNALPLVAGVGIALVPLHARSLSFWLTGVVALALGMVAQFQAQAFYELHPAIHPLLRSDLHFDLELFKAATASLNLHLLHMHPFRGLALFAPLLLSLTCGVLWVREERWLSAAIFIAMVVMATGLGMPKLHEGCESIFFPRSRMFLSLPLLIACAAALLLRGARLGRWPAITAIVVGAIGALFGWTRTEHIIGYEMAHQECAWVREERIIDMRSRCEIISRTARDFEVDLVVPIRWPGIKVDHEAHFAAHLTCYACEQLVKDLPAVYGAGYDRRYWIREAYDNKEHPGRVLFVGGDPAAWSKNPDAVDVSADSVEMHFVTSTSATVSDLLLRTGADDDLGR